MKKGKKLWSHYDGKFDCFVVRRDDGRFEASSGFRGSSSMDTRSKKRWDIFENIEDAFRFVGFPVGIIPLPVDAEELKK